MTNLCIRFCAHSLGFGLAISTLLPASVAVAEESSAAWIWSSKSVGDEDSFAARGQFEIDKA